MLYPFSYLVFQSVFRAKFSAITDKDIKAAMREEGECYLLHRDKVW